MPTVLDAYNPQIIDDTISNKKTKDFVKLTMLHEELERVKEQMYQELSASDKKEVFKTLSKQYNIPDYITVRDVSEILGISPQMVRRHCSDGKIIAHQTLEGSGKWRIETAQFLGKPNWDKFIDKRAKIKKQSTDIANKVLEYLDDVE